MTPLDTSSAPWAGADSVDAHVASEWIMKQVEPLAAVKMPVTDSCGLVLASDGVALESSPAFDTSAMDGYACSRHADSPTACKVIGQSVAGRAFAGTLVRGEAVRIMTGARVPRGADCVAPLEVVNERDGVVTIPSELPAGANIRRRGEDHGVGDVVVGRETRLTPAHLAALASIGHDQPSVIPRPRVGVMSTGDEVEQATSGASGVRDANRPGLLALVQASGFLPVDLGVVRDDATELQERLVNAVGQCDAVITSGGVSVGDHDIAKLAIAWAARSTGGVSRWMRVAVRPARPLVFASVRGVPVFGLPGNPASAFVSYHLFARPALDRLAGRRDAIARWSFTASTAVEFPRRRDGRLYVVPVIAEIARGALSVRPAGDGRRHHLAATAAANAYVHLPDGPSIPAGAAVTCSWIAGRGDT